MSERVEEREREGNVGGGDVVEVAASGGMGKMGEDEGKSKG